MAHETGAALTKDIFEGLNAVNAELSAYGEELLVKVIEDIRSALRAERPAEWPYTAPAAWPIGGTETVLKSWVEYESAHPELAA
jgi:hypothetical protein